MKHDILLHLVNAALEIGIVPTVLRLAAAVEPHPRDDDGDRDGHRHGKVDPQVHRDGICIWPSCEYRVVLGVIWLGDLPSSKLKNDMPNTEARYVPGRKTAPNRDKVFMAVLSLLLACAILRCSPAISRFSLASLCDKIL